MKCEICKNTIEETFLNKIIGAKIKDSKGKFYSICSACQKKFNNDKKKILTTI